MDENSTNQAPGQDAFEGFSQMADALRDAVTKFQEEQSPENFAPIITALSAFGLSSVEMWKTAAEYTRRHPIQVAALAGLAFFAVKGLTSSSRRVTAPQLPAAADLHH